MDIYKEKNKVVVYTSENRIFKKIRRMDRGGIKM